MPDSQPPSQSPLREELIDALAPWMGEGSIPERISLNYAAQCVDESVLPLLSQPRATDAIEIHVDAAGTGWATLTVSICGSDGRRFFTPSDCDKQRVQAGDSLGISGLSDPIKMS